MDNVKNVTSYTGNGLKDWLVQRTSAVILGLYLLYLAGYIICHGSNLTYQVWSDLFSNLFFKVVTVLAILSLILHAWIGIWTVLTDYVKPVWLRGVIEILVILALIGYFIWGVAILWNIQGVLF